MIQRIPVDQPIEIHYLYRTITKILFEKALGRPVAMGNAKKNEKWAKPEADISKELLMNEENFNNRWEFVQLSDILITEKIFYIIILYQSAIPIIIQKI